jgi:hypothetical protein
MLSLQKQAGEDEFYLPAMSIARRGGKKRITKVLLIKLI